MNIVHIVEDLKTGGLERVIAVCASELDRAQFHVAVWCLSAGGAIADELRARGVEVQILNMRSHRDPRFWFALIKKLRTGTIHIVHTHGYPGTTIGRIAAFAAGVPVIIAHLHSTHDEYSWKQRIIERVLSVVTKKIICCSRAVAEFAVRREGIDARKIAVIYNGVNTDIFTPHPAQRGEDTPVFTVGCVASLVAHKGHRYIIKAAEELYRMRPGKIQFVFVGDGVARQELEQQAAAAGVSGAIVFLGARADIPALLATFDALILASCEREGLGLALLEAMSMSIPVIGTRIGGIPEIIHDGENGLLIRPGDMQAIVQAVTTLMADREQAQYLGCNGRRTVEHLFSQREMLEKISELYRSVYHER